MGLQVAHPRETVSQQGFRTATQPRFRSLELGLGLIVIVLPLAFLPASMGPFVDVKLVALSAGALVLWAGHGGHSRLAAPAALWVGAVAIAGLFGVDKWWSLIGPENMGNGLLLLGLSAFLLVAATNVPVAVRDRIPLWLVGASTALASISLVSRVWPQLPIVEGIGLPLVGGTLGNPVFVATFAAVGLVGVVGAPKLKPRPLVLILVVLSSALALSTRRVGWVALAVGLAVALWRTRVPRKRAVLILGVVAASLAAWTVLDGFLSASLSGAGRFGELGAGSSVQSRLNAWTVLGRGWAERPFLGWGPGNSWAAYVSSGTPSELSVDRGYGDAHNIFLEAAVTTGVVGFAAFLVLVGFTARQMRRGLPSTGWAFGVAAGLFVHHLIQPLNVVLTPLLFLTAGLACRASPGEQDGSRPRLDAGPRSIGHLVRPGVGMLIAAALLLSTASLVSSVLERHGRTYASEWALRASLRVGPGRITAGESLAMSLALDARSGDVAAGREARELIARMVRLHPWNPGVRLVAADVHTLMRDSAGAEQWTRRHFARFPGDLPDLRSIRPEPPAPGSR